MLHSEKFLTSWKIQQKIHSALELQFLYDIMRFGGKITKIIYAKINSRKESACVSDVGEILSMTEWGMDDYSGFATLNTMEGECKIDFKPNAVLLLGVVGFEHGENSPEFCSDPRVVMMYLWRIRQHRFNEPETDPPVPTREEAVEWLKKMDIPLEPQETPREWTRKLKRNFLNIKD